mmetsp:Transcript_15857/g.52038  ORF Transcript_15857/g.52038 Transcript_15857/m.52038 type:complete len:276 (+) Transcript_15857:1060-1887(+)
MRAVRVRRHEPRLDGPDRCSKRNDLAHRRRERTRADAGFRGAVLLGVRRGGAVGPPAGLVCIRVLGVFLHRNRVCVNLRPRTWVPPQSQRQAIQGVLVGEHAQSGAGDCEAGEKARQRLARYRVGRQNVGSGERINGDVNLPQRPGARRAVLPDLSHRAAFKVEALPFLRPVRVTHGPPLPDRGYLYRRAEPALLRLCAVGHVSRAERLPVVFVFAPGQSERAVDLRRVHERPVGDHAVPGAVLGDAVLRNARDTHVERHRVQPHRQRDGKRAPV